MHKMEIAIAKILLSIAAAFFWNHHPVLGSLVGALTGTYLYAGRTLFRFFVAATAYFMGHEELGIQIAAKIVFRKPLSALRRELKHKQLNTFSPFETQIPELYEMLLSVWEYQVREESDRKKRAEILAHLMMWCHETDARSFDRAMALFLEQQQKEHSSLLGEGLHAYGVACPSASRGARMIEVSLQLVAWDHLPELRSVSPAELEDMLTRRNLVAINFEHASEILFEELMCAYELAVKLKAEGTEDRAGFLIGMIQMLEHCNDVRFTQALNTLERASEGPYKVLIVRGLYAYGIVHENPSRSQRMKARAQEMVPFEDPDGDPQEAQAPEESHSEEARGRQEASRREETSGGQEADRVEEEGHAQACRCEEACDREENRAQET